MKIKNYGSRHRGSSIAQIMRIRNVFATFAVLAVIGCSCGAPKGDGKGDAAGESLAATVSNGVEVVCCSEDAINAPAYDPDGEWGSPFALNDGLANTMDGSPIVDAGAYSGDENGNYPGDKTKVYAVSLVNQSPDTVTVRSLHLPDSTFRVIWTGIKTYRPGVLSLFKLICDSAVTADDYRFVLTYEGDKYPPQVFHINLRPDILKLIEELDAKNQ